MKAVRLATRGSPLALSQSRWVADLLRPIVAPRPVELVMVQTQGDRDQNRPLAQIGGIGVFTKEVQQAVLDGRADAAVHSLKDLPTDSNPSLTLAAVPRRAAVNDVLVAPVYKSLQQLPNQAVVATGSLRRKAMLLNRRPDLIVADVRGNVDTRLKRVQAGEFDGLILAQAGLERLGRLGEVGEVLDPRWMTPAPGQGALAIECRTDEVELLALLGQLNDADDRAAVIAERTVLERLGGGCQIPVGAWGRVAIGELMLTASVLSADGNERIEGETHGLTEDAIDVGEQAAEVLLQAGAKRLLQRD